MGRRTVHKFPTTANLDTFWTSIVTCVTVFEELFVEPASQKKPSQRPPSVWAYAAGGTQIAVTLLVAFFVGYKLDQRWDTSPWCTLAAAAVGIIGGLYGFFRQAMKW